MRKWVFAGVAILIVGGLIWTLSLTATEVKLYEVKKGDISQTIKETGIVQASNYLGIYSIENGQVEKILVDLGSFVNQGDTLLILTNNDLSLLKNSYKNSLIQAELNYAFIKAELDNIKLDFDEAKNNYNRTEKLYKSGAVSKNELDLAKLTRDKYETTYKQQLNSLEQAKEQLGISRDDLDDINAKEENLIITSPIEGTVVRLPVKEGQFITTSTEVAEVASLNKVEVKAEILSDDMADIKLGQKVKISAPILKETILEGEVINIYPQAEEKLSPLGVTQHRVPIIINLLENDILKPGYEVKVSIETLTKNDVVIIPREAILYKENGDKQVMLVDENGRIQYVNVKTDLGDRVNIEIISGLKVGQKIVLDASNLLKSGTKVKGQ